MNPSISGFLVGCVLCAGAIVFWLSRSPVQSPVSADTSQQVSADRGEALPGSRAEPAVVAGKPNADLNQQPGRGDDQISPVIVDFPAAAIEMSAEPVSELAVVGNDLDAGPVATAGSISGTGSVIDSPLKVTETAAAGGGVADLRPMPVVPVEEAVLQQFWGPFHAEIRAKSFANHLTKLVLSPMLVIERKDGFYIAFEYISQQQRAEILTNLSQSGLSLRLDE